MDESDENASARESLEWGGLCGACRHRRVVTSARGSRFLLCERSKTDPAFPKYPRLPVLRCAGFERGAGGSGDAL
jgi:hypothetical protein